jgi:hypothetical protein
MKLKSSSFYSLDQYDQANYYCYLNNQSFFFSNKIIKNKLFDEHHIQFKIIEYQQDMYSISDSNIIIVYKLIYFFSFLIFRVLFESFNSLFFN